MEASVEPMISMRAVVKHYRTRGRGTVHALDGIDIDVLPGETLGLVGESGCGKSTTARLLVQLEPPTSGEIIIDGQDLATADSRQRRALRRTIQMVFQDPYASLNPRMRIGETLTEVLAVHKLATGSAARSRRAFEVLDLVGLPAETAGRFPHQLSGGQRQRVGIARALAVQPKVLVLDEAVSALDVSVRAEIMNLLARLRDDLGLTYLFISHDLSMVRHISDRIAVMYLGEIVEIGTWDTVSDRPAHPYSVALQSAVPTADPLLEAARQPLVVSGEVPDAAHPPVGCRFHPRCPLAEDICRREAPQLRPFEPGVKAAGHQVADRNAHRLACHVVQREGRPAGDLIGALPLVARLSEQRVTGAGGD